MSCDSSRATCLHALQRRLHPETTYTEPESLEIMLHLLIVALPLVVALPAAFDEQELNAFLFEVQSRLQSNVRSPPESSSCPTMIWPSSRPALSQCACSEPGAVVLETATPSALCIPSTYATPSSSPHTPHTHYCLPNSSPLQLERPATAETRSSCLRAAIARQALICTSDLIGGIPRPFLGISIARFQPSTSTYVATSLYDRSDCSDASSD